MDREGPHSRKLDSSHFLESLFIRALE